MQMTRSENGMITMSMHDIDAGEIEIECRVVGKASVKLSQCHHQLCFSLALARPVAYPSHTSNYQIYQTPRQHAYRRQLAL